MKILGWPTRRTLAFILIGATAALAQSPPAPNPYQPTEVQQLRLKVAQQAAQLAQQQLRDAQQNFQQSVANLSAAGEKVKQENKWGDDVILNLDTLEFTKKAPPVKKEDKK